MAKGTLSRRMGTKGRLMVLNSTRRLLSCTFSWLLYTTWAAVTAADAEHCMHANLAGCTSPKHGFPRLFKVFDGDAFAGFACVGTQIAREKTVCANSTGPRLRVVHLSRSVVSKAAGRGYFEQWSLFFQSENTRTRD